jgi:6-phosphogluconolactonase/glucosamine-6-phosphate isomerase/deaminase
MSASPDDTASGGAATPEHKLKILIARDKTTMGFAAASCGAEFIRQAVLERGHANVIVATGASQFEVLASLIRASGIDWGKCHFFHLDEYIGIEPTHGLCEYARLHRVVLGVSATKCIADPCSKPTTVCALSGSA